MVSVRILIRPVAMIALAVAPASPQVKLTPGDQGDLFMVRKMYREAIDSYREGAANSAILRDKIGIAYHMLGDLAAAKKSYESAIKLDPKYADAINNVGTVFYARKKYGSAIARYRKALALSPDSASIWSNLGTAYYARGQYDRMSEAYQKALKLDPQVFESRNQIGTEVQDRSVADRARYHFEIARIYAHAGNNDMALQYLRRSLEEGFKDREKLNKAPEFAGLRDTQKFKDLMTLEPRVL